MLLGVYNVLPGLPLDGGAVLESIVWGITGDEHRGTVVAGWVGRVVAVLVLVAFVAPSILAGRPPDLTSIVIAAVISAFLWSGASQALRAGTGVGPGPGPERPRRSPGARSSSRTTPRSPRRCGRLAEAEAGGLVVVDAEGRPVAVSQEAAVARGPGRASTLGAGLVGVRGDRPARGAGGGPRRRGPAARA